MKKPQVQGNIVLRHALYYIKVFNPWMAEFMLRPKPCVKYNLLKQ